MINKKKRVKKTVCNNKTYSYNYDYYTIQINLRDDAANKLIVEYITNLAEAEETSVAAAVKLIIKQHIEFKLGGKN